MVAYAGREEASHRRAVHSACCRKYAVQHRNLAATIITCRVHWHIFITEVLHRQRIRLTLALALCFVSRQNRAQRLLLSLSRTLLLCRPILRCSCSLSDLALLGRAVDYSRPGPPQTAHPQAQLDACSSHSNGCKRAVAELKQINQRQMSRKQHTRWLSLAAWAVLLGLARCQAQGTSATPPPPANLTDFSPPAPVTGGRSHSIGQAIKEHRR